MKVLVTGGAGFIGSHVVDRLRARRIDVRVFDMVMPTFRKDIEFYHGSLLDHEALRMAVSGIDVIYHLAAVADVKDVYEEPGYAESINVRGTMNVLEAARKSKIRRVIYGSTTWVYGDSVADVIDEDTPLGAPSHLYTATKIASEHYCQCYSKLYGVPITILRYGIPYGPRARDGTVIPIFVRKALNGEALTIAGDGSQFRQFIYVEDLAEGNVLALKPAAENRLYNLDGAEKITIARLAQTIQRLIGDVRIESVPARASDFGGKEISSRRAAVELGWRPQVTIEEGIRWYLDWYRRREQERHEAWSKIDGALAVAEQQGVRPADGRKKRQASRKAVSPARREGR